MSSNEGSDMLEITELVVLVDEDGNEMTFEIHSQITIGSRRYAVLVPEDPSFTAVEVEESQVLVVLRVERDPVSGLDQLVDIEEEEESERVWIAAEAHLNSLRYCHGCGCTDEHACEGGCSWASETHCSRCAEGMTMEITQDMRWVLNTPISDANALTSLERLSAEQIRYCLEQLKDKPYTVSKVKRLEARLRKLERGRAAAGAR